MTISVGDSARKANELLHRWLTPAQADSLMHNMAMIINGSLGGKYLLNWQNAVVARNRSFAHECFYQYCIQALGVPRSDEMLAIKLLMETDEAAFLKTANVVTTCSPINMFWSFHHPLLRQL